MSGADAPGTDEAVTRGDGAVPGGARHDRTAYDEVHGGPRRHRTGRSRARWPAALAGTHRVKDPAYRDTLEGEGPVPRGTSPRGPGPRRGDEGVRRPEDGCVAEHDDARQELLDVVTKSLDSKGVDAE
ncbi:hypothetical protein GCM10010293_65010 [Streptomyces griseoflavus]|nr:hypothetical protein GCM10010293_65010 [Streptomyces griseoflavus]